MGFFAFDHRKMDPAHETVPMTARDTSYSNTKAGPAATPRHQIGLRTRTAPRGRFTEQEIRHVSLHDLRHGALTELASVSPNLPGISVTIPVTDVESADLKDVAAVLTIRNHDTSEGGGIGRRAGFRLQDQRPDYS